MSLNNKQRIIIIVGFVLFILMGLFPPWIHTLHFKSIYREKPAGYALIISPPKPERNTPVFGVKIDIARLFVQWSVVAAATGLGLLLARSKNKINNE